MNYTDDENLLTNASYNHKLPSREFVDDRHKFWKLFFDKALFCTPFSCSNYSENKNTLDKLVFPFSSFCIFFVICKKDSHWVEMTIDNDDKRGNILFNSIYPQKYDFESEVKRKLSWDISRPGRPSSIVGILPYKFGFNCIAQWEHICSHLIDSFGLFHHAITYRTKNLGFTI